jgi:hypothetical protein
VLKKEVKIGSVYTIRHSGKITHVRLLNENRFGGWNATNLSTGRIIRIKSAAKLRQEFPNYGKGDINE